MNILKSVAFIMLSSTCLQAQDHLGGSTFALRFATTLSPKNDIKISYVEPEGVDYYSKNTLGYEFALNYRLTKPRYRYTAGLKTGWYPIDKRLFIQAAKSPAGYDFSANSILFQSYYGIETSLEIRLHVQKKLSVFAGPAVQIVYSSGGYLYFEDGYIDESNNLHIVYRSNDLSVNAPNRPYLGFGGKFSLETPIAKRIGLGFTLGYLYSKRDLLDAGSYIIYTVDGPLQGTLTKPFQYLSVGVELSLLRKSKIAE